MVYHGFRGDSEIDSILKEQKNKSDFIKNAVKAYVPARDAPKPVTPEPKRVKIIV